jgi:methylenetetrahydrofolate dehydrogenase (NADP+) / methenyltetrahydrofolate cyclohydrolase
MTRVFDCRAVAAKYQNWVLEAVSRLRVKPCLATVLFAPTRHPASIQYRDLAHKDAAKLGLVARSYEPERESELLELIAKLNDDDEITGIMVFYPLNAKTADEDVMDLVSPKKDVEGLHSINLGYLIKYKQFFDEARRIKCVVPATAKGVVKLLQHYPEVKLEGAWVAIVNNSMRVGKPVGLMLENLGATVVKCYHLTKPEALESAVRGADIVITAVPDPKFRLDPSWVRPGAAVVDVTFQGNVDVAALKGRAAFIRPPSSPSPATASGRSRAR